MPKMDDGLTDGPPGRALMHATVVLTQGEARDLLDGLQVWAQGLSEGAGDPNWHMHLTDDTGGELTIAITPEPPS
ncbi:MAG: hypothetical protein ABI323_12975 [Solirubrobacteraceae bacterium]